MRCPVEFSITMKNSYSFAVLDEDLARQGVPAFLPLRLVSEITGKSPEVLARLARAGALRACRTPSLRGRGPWIVRRADLAAFLSGMELHDART